MWRSSEEISGVKKVPKILSYTTTTGTEVKADREVVFAMPMPLRIQHNHRPLWPLSISNRVSALLVLCLRSACDDGVDGLEIGLGYD